ncbi:hypothetical protein [Paraburkholderia sp. C35]|uniref:hypothetical protein n=1 Tax=Paraburkholderia sp. C35 TaxID=2126993 RepID=UPI000D68C11D|nr:hypothetical protein [Paraburkholderia sp. C35]
MPNTKHDRLLQDALLAAMSHMARLDDSTPVSIYRAPTKLLMWILRQRNPRLTFQIYQEDLADQLIAILDEYAQLRAFSIQFVEEEYDPHAWNIPKRRVQLEHLEYALTRWDAPASKHFRELFAKAALDITQRQDIDGRLVRAERALLRSLRRPVPPQGFDHEGATRILEFKSATRSTTDNVKAAVNWVSRYLTRMDNGADSNFWKAVDANVAIDWLKQDKPDLMRALLAGECLDEVRVAATRLVEGNRRTELVWAALGHYLRDLLKIHCDRNLALRIIKLMMSTMRDDIAHDVSAESVYSMFSRRLRPPHLNETQRLRETEQTAVAIDYLRTEGGSSKGCFLLEYKSLPRSLWNHSAERYCLAVHLPDDWLQQRDQLARDDGIRRFFSEYQHGESCFHIKVNRSFWMPHDDALKVLEHFRSELPVAYVFGTVVILVVYRFNRFTDFESIARVRPKYLDTYTLNDGDWIYAAANQTVSRKDGSQLKPTIFDTVGFFPEMDRIADKLVPTS